MIYVLLLFLSIHHLNDNDAVAHSSIRIENYFQQHTLHDFYLEMDGFPFKVKLEEELIKRSNIAEKSRGKLVYNLNPTKRKNRQKFDLDLFMYEPHLRDINEGVIYCVDRACEISQFNSFWGESMLILDDSNDTQLHILLVKEINIDKENVYFFVFEVISDTTFLSTHDLSKEVLIEMWSKAVIKEYEGYY